MNKKYAKKRNDLISGAVLCIVAAAYFYGATKIKMMKMLTANYLNAASVPKLWGALLFVLGVILIVRGACGMSAEKAAGHVPHNRITSQLMNEWLGANYAVVLMFAVLTLYIALISPLGFLPATILFLWGEFNILSRKEERKPVMTGILAVGCGLGIYVLFKYAFSMPLPQGILRGIF